MKIGNGQQWRLHLNQGIEGKVVRRIAIFKFRFIVEKSGEFSLSEVRSVNVEV